MHPAGPPRGVVSARVVAVAATVIVVRSGLQVTVIERLVLSTDVSEDHTPVLCCLPSELPVYSLVLELRQVSGIIGTGDGLQRLQVLRLLGCA